MVIILYRIDEPTNKLEKTLENGVSVTGTLRADTSIITPTIKLGFDCSAYNYMYIPVFNRYYYITDITILSDTMFEITTQVDVLMSYADSIKNLTAILTNGENINPYNSDADYPTEIRTEVKQIDFPYTFAKDDYMVMVAVGSGLVG